MPLRLLLGFAVFLGIFSSLLFLAHDYVLSRLVMVPAWPAAVQHSLAIVVWTLAGLQLVVPFAIRALPPAFARWLAWPGYAWLGVVFYLLLLSAASHGALFLLGLGDERGATRSAALVVTCITGLVSLYGLGAALATPRVRRVRVALSHWPEALAGYRIVQLSDIHIGAILQREYARRLVQRCNELAADLIAITGDLVDGKLDHLAEHVAPFADLRAKDGVYFVTGNHDHYAGASEWSAYLDRLGLRVLRNEHAVVRRTEGSFLVGGVYDRTSSATDDVASAFADAEPGLARLLLAHHPETFHKAIQHRVDLQLSGHTHAGQMWPFRYLVNLQTRFVDGLHRLGPHALYVSRGTGFWGPPLRVLAPAEITELVLERAG